MCTEQTEQDNVRFLAQTGSVDRRSFGKLSAAALLASIAPACATASETMTEADVEITMPDGVSDSYFVAPATGRHPGVLMWPDIRGLRPAFRAMGKRLAASGYAVLVVNPFYRDMKAPVVGPDASFADPETRAFLFGMAGKLTQDAAMSDARAYIAFLDVQDSVDTSRKIGTAGYCMGGPLIMRTAGAVPERVGAAASFHAGRMVTDAPDSPHLLIPTSNAQVLHAIAGNDDENEPHVKTVLAEAYAAANTPAEIEVYDGTLHGWCPPDSPVYNEAQAERAWSRLLALYETALV